MIIISKSYQNHIKIMSKMDKALQVIRECIGTKGVWASKDRYQNQCWTRDFCLATSRLFLSHPDLQDLTIVQNHLENLIKMQKPDGKIPILFLDNEKQFLRSRIEKSIQNGKISFMLRRYLEDGLEDLTPHTRDSEILFVITVCEYILEHEHKKSSRGPLVDATCFNFYMSACKAIKYAEENILKDGLVAGADWRDVREDLHDKTVLTNACFLYRAYNLLEKVSINFKTITDSNEWKFKATFTKSLIEKNFWNGEYFMDYPGCHKFDLLGNSLVVLYGIANEKQIESIFIYTMSITGKHGIHTTETFLPPLNEEEKKVMDRDKAVIWPFTNGFMMLAMLGSNEEKWKNFAKEQFGKWIKLDGFYEWYDIMNGKGYGSPDQVWSAALYLRVDAMAKI